MAATEEAKAHKPERGGSSHSSNSCNVNPSQRTHKLERRSSPRKLERQTSCRGYDSPSRRPREPERRSSPRKAERQTSCRSYDSPSRRSREPERRSSPRKLERQTSCRGYDSPSRRPREPEIRTTTSCSSYDDPSELPRKLSRRNSCRSINNPTSQRTHKLERQTSCRSYDDPSQQPRQLERRSTFSSHDNPSEEPLEPERRSSSSNDISSQPTVKLESTDKLERRSSGTSFDYPSEELRKLERRTSCSSFDDPNQRTRKLERRSSCRGFDNPSEELRKLVSRTSCSSFDDPSQQPRKLERRTSCKSNDSPSRPPREPERRTSSSSSYEDPSELPRKLTRRSSCRSIDNPSQPSDKLERTTSCSNYNEPIQRTEKPDVRGSRSSNDIPIQRTHKPERPRSSCRSVSSSRSTDTSSRRASKIDSKTTERSKRRPSKQAKDEDSFRSSSALKLRSGYDPFGSNYDSFEMDRGSKHRYHQNRSSREEPHASHILKTLMEASLVDLYGEIESMDPKQQQQRMKKPVKQERKRSDHEEGKIGSKSTLSRPEKANPEEGSAAEEASDSHVMNTLMEAVMIEQFGEEGSLDLKPQQQEVKPIRKPTQNSLTAADLFGSDESDEDEPRKSPEEAEASRKALSRANNFSEAIAEAGLQLSKEFGDDDSISLPTQKTLPSYRKDLTITDFFGSDKACLQLSTCLSDDGNISVLSESEAFTTEGSSHSNKRRQTTSGKNEERGKINSDDQFSGHDSFSISSLQFDKKVMNWDDEGAINALLSDMKALKKTVTLIDAENCELRKQVRCLDDQNRELKNTLLQEADSAKQLIAVKERNVQLKTELAKAIQMAKEKVDYCEQRTSIILDKMEATQRENCEIREIFQKALKKHQYINHTLEQRTEEFAQRMFKLEHEIKSWGQKSPASKKKLRFKPSRCKVHPGE